jgi:hypothetical protein
MVQWRQRAEEEERGAPQGGGAPFKGRTRRWPRAAETVGETVGRSGRQSRGWTRWRPRFECGRQSRCSDRVADGWDHAVL